jgi:hypothetical protein
MSGGLMTPKEIAAELAKVKPDVAGIPEWEREIIALHAIYTPIARIAKMLSYDEKMVAEAVARYSSFVEDIGDAMRMKVMRMIVWRFAATQVSVLMDTVSTNPQTAVKMLSQIPKILDQLADAEKKLLSAEKEHKEINFDDFGKSLGK